METSINIPNGVLEYQDPFEFTSGNIGFNADILPLLPKRRLQYFNQNEYYETKMACTIVNAFRQWCHRVGKEFTKDEMIALVKYSVTQSYVIGGGRGTAQAMNATQKYITLNYPEYKTSYISLQYNDPEVGKAMIKNHAIGITYRGNHDWDTDRLDGTLDLKGYKPMTYGHRTCMIMESQITVDDSFSFQHYKISYFNDLVKSGNIYPTVYLWLVDSNLDVESVKKYTKWKVMLEQNISNNNIMLNDPRRGTNDKTYRDLLTKDNILLQKKLDFVNRELKNNGL